LFLLAGLAVLWVLTRRRAPAIGFGLLWIALALAPVSNLLAATGLVVAERVMFLPSVGLAIGLGGAFAWLWSRLRIQGTAVKAVAAATAVGLLVAAGVKSVSRGSAWRSQPVFFDQLLRDAPRSYRAHYVASRYYFGERDYANAERAARSALALYPDDPRIHEQLGQVLRVEGRCGDALPILEAGLGLEPEGTILRSRLIECALATGDTVRARAVARDGVRRGLTEFRQTLDRLPAATP
jgi:tetratricopeptide (TPR) repeat protein